MLGLLETPLDWLGFGVYMFAYFCLLSFAFQKSKTWGFLVLIFSPVSSLVFALLNRKDALFWFGAMVLGIALMVLL